MGKKLEATRKKVENVNEMSDKVKEMGEQDVEDIGSVRDLLGEIPDDVDDDIKEAVESVDDSSTQEATDHMNSEVKSVLDQSEQASKEVVEEADDQKEKSQEASDKFAEIGGKRFGGAGMDASKKAADSASAFEEMSTQAADLARQASDDFNSSLEKVMKH